LSQRSIYSLNQPLRDFVERVPPRAGKPGDPADIQIFGTGAYKRVATATYDSDFVAYLARLGVLGLYVDVVDLAINGAVPPVLGGF
jgi:hypothetical protein